MADQEDYRSWARHFGKSTRHPDVVAEFQRAGVAKAPVINRDELDTCIEFPGLTVNFADPLVIPTTEKVGAGVGVLFGIAMHFADGPIYTGSVPYSVQPRDSRDSLRQRLGDPAESDDVEAWDRWNIDGFEVTAMYMDGFSAVRSLSVYLPEEDQE
jgi:hypothetical protein